MPREHTRTEWLWRSPATAQRTGRREQGLGLGPNKGNPGLKVRFLPPLDVLKREANGAPGWGPRSLARPPGLRAYKLHRWELIGVFLHLSAFRSLAATCCSRSPSQPFCPSAVLVGKHFDFGPILLSRARCAARGLQSSNESMSTDTHAMPPNLEMITR